MDEGFTYLESFTNFEVQPGLTRAWRLERMEELCLATGNPESRFASIHIAGSKGKGSTATYLAALLEASGEPTGLYTSPHIEDYRERITRSGTYLPEDLYLEGLRWVEESVRRIEKQRLTGGELPTTFELLTLLAFKLFGSFPLAVLETGMGGRLDATNVVRPLATAITPIELEHTEYLGDTIEAIAGEKAGIIKEGVPVFTAPLHPEAQKVVNRKAKQMNAECLAYADIVEEESISVSRRGTEVEAAVFGERFTFRLSLLGRRQARNALLALAVARRLRPEISPQLVASALPAVSLPGRMELLSGDPSLVIDGAHTPESVASLCETLKELYPSKWTLIFGSVAGKRHREMAEILIPLIREVIVLRPGRFRQSNLEELASPFRNARLPCRIEEDAEGALTLAVDAAPPESCIVAVGSFYLAGAVRRAARELGGWHPIPEGGTG